MAITIVNNPPIDSSINDESWVTVSSTNAGTTNFKFVFDIKIAGNLVSRSKVFPNPADNYGYFNSAPIVRSFITNYFEPSGSSILVASNDKIAVRYNLEIREEVSGGINVLPDASASFSAFNFYYPVFADLYTSGSTTVQNVYQNALTQYKDNFLTERDLREVKVNYGDRFYISFLRVEGTGERGYVRTLDSAGNVVASHNALLSLSGSFNLFNLSASAINTWAGSTLITENTYAYEFYITGAGTSRVVRILHNCSKYPSYNVHFINRLGGWDTFNFNLVNRQSVNLEKQFYQRADWQRSGGLMKTWDSYNRYNETKVAFNIQHNNKISLKSNWVNEIDYDWLAQLVASSNAYIEVQSMYLPLYISTTNYDYKLLNVDKIFNLELEAEIPKNINSQFR
jgi:hypothetical protein